MPMTDEQYRALDAMSGEVAKSVAQKQHERSQEIVTLHVWVCPTKGCGNFYGSSSDQPLTEQFTGPKVEDRAELERKTGSPWKHNRAECPDCRAKGMKVQRARVAVQAALPEARPAPPLPRRRYGVDSDAA